MSQDDAKAKYVEAFIEVSPVSAFILFAILSPSPRLPFYPGSRMIGSDDWYPGL
jgi:hypothetical protein